MAETFKVTSQSPDLELDSTGGRFVNGWKVTYEVTSGPASGTPGTVFVTEANHNAQALNAAISAKVKDLTEIAQLGQK